MGDGASMKQGKQQVCEGVQQKHQDRATGNDHTTQDRDPLVVWATGVRSSLFPVMSLTIIPTCVLLNPFHQHTT